jgi:myosin-crossreactive antigen
MSQVVTGAAEKGNQEPMADQVMTMETKLNLCLIVKCCSHLTNIKDFWLLWLSMFLQKFDCGE